MLTKHLRKRAQVSRASDLQTVTLRKSAYASRLAYHVRDAAMQAGRRGLAVRGSKRGYFQKLANPLSNTVRISGTYRFKVEGCREYSHIRILLFTLNLGLIKLRFD